MISILTPVYNGENYLTAMLNSVTNQNAKFEHIIQDGGSTDNTIKLLNAKEWKHNLSVESEKDDGMYDALCKAFKRSKGDVIGWINADDVLLPDSLQKIEFIFRKNPQIDWISSIPTTIINNSYIPNSYMPSYSRTLIRLGFYSESLLGHIQQETCFFRRSLWEKAKPDSFLPKYKFAGDFALWKEFSKHSKPTAIPLHLAGFRKHEDQLSADVKAYTKELNSIFKNVPKIKGGRFMGALISVIKNSKREKLSYMNGSNL